MRAARFHGPGEGLVVEEVPRPEPGPGEVLIDVSACGLCHSDLHLMHGDLPIPTPRTLGHEAAGEVAATGPGVDHLDPGTSAVVFGGWGCGHCEVCTRGDDQLCNVLEWAGIGQDGALADFVVVPDAKYVLPTEIDPVEAAPLTDAALTPYRAVQRARQHLSPTDTLLVVGIGGLGQFGVQFAAMTGAQVVAADQDAEKLALAEDLGADVTVDVTQESIQSAVRRVTDDGADAAIDFVGKDETLQACGNALGTQGRLYIVGIGGGSFELSFNPLVGSELVCTNVFWGSIDQLRDVLDLAEAGRLDVGVEPVGFEDLAATYDRLEAGDVDRRAVLVPE
ncbi:NAD(P)-dependent alcohol dehydrogenase [Halorientalis halophila]|uniref:NAD(P)-dependent alcohol dehydrogenase n=1 Tax=Halorientalis halophila TaxID=3108499 RepID=UPI003009E19C